VNGFTLIIKLSYGAIMELDNRKAAVIAAVMRYIKSEEELLEAAVMAARGPAPVAASVKINHWGLSGRQTMMQMRNLMQIKGFHGARHR
jgi:hypothetical protein